VANESYDKTADPAPLYPVSVDEAKVQCRYEGTDENTLFAQLIASETALYEATTGIQCLTATWVWRLDGFPDDSEALRPMKYPLSSVTSVQYVDTAGATQTMSSANYTLDAITQPGRIALAYNESWPVTRDVIDAVIVTFVAGYGTTRNNVPGDIKRYLLRRVARAFDFRYNGDTGNRSTVGAENIPDPFYWGTRVRVI
jgi:uncharacterized phiE125 gp8 family phage protein